MPKEWMLPVLALAPLVIVVAVVAARTKVVYLDELGLEPNERIMLDAIDCRAERRVAARNQAEVFPSAVVRLTSRRLIVAQRGLFSSRLLVRLVVLYEGAVPPRDQEAGAFKTYGNVRLTPGSVQVDGAADPPRLTLAGQPERDNPSPYPMELVLTTPRAHELAEALAP